jgi:hypothetical protein
MAEDCTVPYPWLYRILRTHGQSERVRVDYLAHVARAAGITIDDLGYLRIPLTAKP